MIPTHSFGPKDILVVALLVTGLLAAAEAQQVAPLPEAKLPLAEYLRLVERAEGIERAAARPTPVPEPKVAALASQSERIVLDHDTARVTSAFEVELRGTPEETVSLPLTGFASSVTVSPPRGTVLRTGSTLAFTAPDPGRYLVEVEGVAGMGVEGGVSRLAMAAVEAPVARTEVELPVGLAWSCAGATVASEEVRGERRVVELALRRGVPHVLEVRREVKGEEQARTLARAVVVTLVSVRPEGVRRHDVVLYEVARGSVGSFEVGVPAGVEVDRLASDEGELPPVVDGERVVVQRVSQLTGTG